MMIPILKEAWKIQQNQIPSFIAHRHTATLYRSGREPAILIPQSVASSSSLAGSASEEPIASTGSQTLYLPDSDFNTLRPWRSFIPSSKPVKGKAKATAPEHPEWPTDPPSPLTRALARARLFNTREERRMYGVSPADPDRSKMPIDPEIYRQAKGDAWKALGIATAIVGTCATAGVWLTSKLMGVSTVSRFLALAGKTHSLTSRRSKSLPKRCVARRGRSFPVSENAWTRLDEKRARLALPIPSPTRSV